MLTKVVIVTLEMFNSEGENIDIMEMEEGGIELLVSVEGIVATEGFSTSEK